MERKNNNKTGKNQNNSEEVKQQTNQEQTQPTNQEQTQPTNQEQINIEQQQTNRVEPVQERIQLRAEADVNEVRQKQKIQNQTNKQFQVEPVQADQLNIAPIETLFQLQKLNQKQQNDIFSQRQQERRLIRDFELTKQKLTVTSQEQPAEQQTQEQKQQLKYQVEENEATKDFLKPMKESLAQINQKEEAINQSEEVEEFNLSEEINQNEQVRPQLIEHQIHKEENKQFEKQQTVQEPTQMQQTSVTTQSSKAQLGYEPTIEEERIFQANFEEISQIKRETLEYVQQIPQIQEKIREELMVHEKIKQITLPIFTSQQTNQIITKNVTVQKEIVPDLLKQQHPNIIGSIKKVESVLIPHSNETQCHTQLQNEAHSQNQPIKFNQSQFQLMEIVDNSIDEAEPVYNIEEDAKSSKSMVFFSQNNSIINNIAGQFNDKSDSANDATSIPLKMLVSSVVGLLTGGLLSYFNGVKSGLAVGLTTAAAIYWFKK